MVRKILEIPRLRYHIYNRDENCYKITFTAASIRSLRDKYQHIRGQPRFIDDLLHLDPESGSLQMFRKEPKLIKWSDAGDVLILPNYETYKDRIDEITWYPNEMKNKKGGVELTVWYIHPKQLEETVFSDPEKRKKFLNTVGCYTYVPDLSPKNRFERLEERKRIHELEKPYFASILDLKPEHATWLRNMKQTVMNHLRDVYDVSEADKTYLFFHQVISELTTTLHLHVRVNQAIHPYEESKAIALDELIAGLESGKTGEELMLEHNKGVLYVGPGTRDMFKGLPETKIEEISNPFKTQSPLISIEMPQVKSIGKR